MEAAADSHRWYLATIFIVLEKSWKHCPLPDLRDIELKLGRKVPESFSRCARPVGRVSRFPRRGQRPQRGSGGGGSGCSSSSSCCSFPLLVVLLFILPATSYSPRPSHSSSTLERLETKLHLLRQEMVSGAPAAGSGNPAARPGRWSRGERATKAEQRLGAWETLVRGAQRARIWM